MPSNQTPNTRTYMSPRQDAKLDKPIKEKRFKLSALLSRKNAPWVLIAVLLIASIFLFVQYRQAQNKLAGNIGENAKNQRSLQKLIILPSDDKPTIATIKESGKLKSQAFFRDAQNGDVLFVFSKTRKAILYRPSDNIIVNVQPVSSPGSIPVQKK